MIPKLTLLNTRRSGIELAFCHGTTPHDSLLSFYSISKNIKHSTVLEHVRKEYDTTFAHWNPDGSMSHLTRPLEIIPDRVAVPGADGLWFELGYGWRAFPDLKITATVGNATKVWFPLWPMGEKEFFEVKENIDNYEGISGEQFKTDFANWTESGQFAGLKGQI